MIFYFDLLKAKKLPVGHITTLRSGKKVRKVADGKWVEVADKKKESGLSLKQKRKELGFKRDNPNDERWLKENRNTVTAYYPNINIPVSEVSNIEGENKEHEFLYDKSHKEYKQQQKHVDHLVRSFRRDGFDINEPITLGIKHDGKITVHEGNHRLAAAKKAGLSHVVASVLYIGGAEELKNVFDPAKIKGVSKNSGLGSRGYSYHLTSMGENREYVYSKAKRNEDEDQWIFTEPDGTEHRRHPERKGKKKISLEVRAESDKSDFLSVLLGPDIKTHEKFVDVKDYEKEKKKMISELSKKGKVITKSITFKINLGAKT